MSGLRAIVVCRWPSPPPRGRTLCTLARESRTWVRHDFCRGTPHDAPPCRTPRACRASRICEPAFELRWFCAGKEFTPEPRLCAPQCQGRGYSMLLPVREVARRTRVTMRGVRCRPMCFYEPTIVPRLSVAGTRARERAGAHPHRSEPGRGPFGCRDAALAGTDALLAAPQSSRAGLRAVPDRVNRDSSAQGRPGQCTPACEPDRRRRRRHQGAAPKRERAARLGRGRSVSCRCQTGSNVQMGRIGAHRPMQVR
jgi:hypothetical protein